MKEKYMKKNETRVVIHLIIISFLVLLDSHTYFGYSEKNYLH